MEVLKLLVPILVAHAVILVIVIVAIKRLLMGDTLNAVARIRQVEAEVRKKEEGIRKEIEEHEQEFTRKKAEAESELQKQRQESERELGKMKDTIVAEAKKEADRIMEQARRNEEKLRQQIAQDMEGKAVGYAGDIFRLVFSERMNAALNRECIAELLDALEEVDAASITVDATQAEFRSSHAIEADQKERLEKLLHEKFGVPVKVQEKVDEALLGGIAFKLGSLEIDGSLLNRFNEAAVEVRKSAHV